MVNQLHLVLDRNQELDELIAETLAGRRGPWALGTDAAKLLGKLALVRGSQFPVSVQKLADFVGVSPREVKAIVKDLVENFGIPIGASRGEPHGYYLVMTLEEMRTTVRVYEGEVFSLLRRIRTLNPKHRMVELFGQMKLQEDSGGGEAA